MTRSEAASWMGLAFAVAFVIFAAIAPSGADLANLRPGLHSR
jgi:hypothetical protein